MSVWYNPELDELCLMTKDSVEFRPGFVDFDQGQWFLIGPF